MVRILILFGGSHGSLFFQPLGAVDGQGYSLAMPGLRWREAVVNLSKKGHNADPGAYRGIALLSTVGKTPCKILSDRRGTVMEKKESISEERAGFRANRSCVDHVYALGTISQGRKNAGLRACCSFY